MHQLALPALWRGIQELLPNPGHRRVLRDIEQDQVTARMFDEEEHIECLEGQGLHHERSAVQIPAISLRRKVR
jgi:hypothetical protein